MKNNWKEKIINLLDEKPIMLHRESVGNLDELIEVFQDFGNLIFEATKKECTKNIKLKEPSIENEYYEINKESILNIKKPNL